jgi:hypothetical protein
MKNDENTLEDLYCRGEQEPFSLVDQSQHGQLETLQMLNNKYDTLGTTLGET